MATFVESETLSEDLADKLLDLNSDSFKWYFTNTAPDSAADEAIADLALLKAVGQSNIVVGPYLIEAKRGPGGPEPTHFREAFRQRGPSNYFHGIQTLKQAKQTEASNV